ncbi:MAG: rhamnogalacturonan lyase [Verrucomicrobia bacterium]|nr:rhamnogalacturonan lyase [Verrucomicrobiota bacterium]
METLGRGVIAIKSEPGKIFVSWRVLGTDPVGLAFNLYRSADGATPEKLNLAPLTGATHFIDATFNPAAANTYSVRPLLAGAEPPPSARTVVATIPANAPARPYFSIPLKTPAGYTPNDTSVGDLDGDGEYEIIVHLTGRARDNSRAGITDEPIFHAYKLDGTLLWSINLGKNIREGAHYTQFLVYDFDGDGRAELICKTADGTVDGIGKVIGDAKADYRTQGDDLVPSRDPSGSVTTPDGKRMASRAGYVLAGPEFLTVFDGRTGAALATADYVPARGDVNAWGDAYGNRVDRFLAGVAYLDGVRPSAVMCRGYYTRTVLAAWDWRDGKLTQRWVFDSDQHGPADNTNPYRGQGNHNLSAADVDGDGRDEIVYGAMCINADGTPRYSTKLGHGDALHVSDLDPTRPGLEVFAIHENPKHPYGIEFRDANTGALIWGKPGDTATAPDVGRGVAFDIDPRHPGNEVWSTLPGLNNARGEIISAKKPNSVNFAVWWDGDLLRELLNSNTVSKWDWLAETTNLLFTADGCTANNSTKSNPALSADLLGDWREEVILRTTDNQELRIFSTTIATAHRLTTLMHDPQYRLAIAWQNVGYNQPPHPGFFLGEGMKPAPRPNLTFVAPSK